MGRTVGLVAFVKRRLDCFHSSTLALVDEEGIISGVLAGIPDGAEGPEWDRVSEGAAEAIAHGVEKMSFGGKNLDSWRGKFASCSAGYSFGGGRETVGNICIEGKRNREVFDGILRDKNVERIVGFTNGQFCSSLSSVLLTAFVRYVQHLCP